MILPPSSSWVFVGNLASTDGATYAHIKLALHDMTIDVSLTDATAPPVTKGIDDLAHYFRGEEKSRESEEDSIH